MVENLQGLLNGWVPSEISPLALTLVGLLIAIFGARVLVRPWMLLPLIAAGGLIFGANHQAILNPTELVSLGIAVLFVFCAVSLLRAFAALLVKGAAVALWAVLLLGVGSQLHSSGLLEGLSWPKFINSNQAAENQMLSSIEAASRNLLSDWSQSVGLPVEAITAKSGLAVKEKVKNTTAKGATLKLAGLYTEGLEPIKFAKEDHSIKFGAPELVRF